MKTFKQFLVEDSHEEARRKAKVHFEPYHVVYNKKSGTTYPMRKSHYDSQQATSHLEIQGTYHHNDDKTDAVAYVPKPGAKVTILPKHVQMAAQIRAMNAGKI